jgi:hypothetical protein
MLRAVELQKTATDTFNEMVDSIPGNSQELRISWEYTGNIYACNTLS